MYHSGSFKGTVGVLGRVLYGLIEGFYGCSLKGCKGHSRTLKGSRIAFKGLYAHMGVPKIGDPNIVLQIVGSLL